MQGGEPKRLMPVGARPARNATTAGQATGQAGQAKPLQLHRPVLARMCLHWLHHALYCTKILYYYKYTKAIVCGLTFTDFLL